MLFFIFSGFELADKGQKCRISKYQETVEEKRFCTSAVPYILRKYPNTSMDIIRKTSNEYPKGCFITKDATGIKEYVIMFNTPPETTASTKYPRPKVTAQQSSSQSVNPNESENDDKTTPIIPNPHTNNDEIQQVCKLIDRK